MTATPADRGSLPSRDYVNLVGGPLDGSRWPTPAADLVDLVVTHAPPAVGPPAHGAETHLYRRHPDHPRRYDYVRELRSDE